MLATVWLTDALVVRYAEGVMDMAASEGARAGSVSSSPVSTCSWEARVWLREGLGGSMGERVHISCTATTDSVTAVLTGRFDAWLPGVPDWEVRSEAIGVREP